MSTADRVHPLEGATDIVKGELDPNGKYMKAVIAEVWGDNPPFAVRLSATERAELFKFALSSSQGYHDFEEHFGAEATAKLARKYDIPVPGEQPAEGEPGAQEPNP